MKVATLSFERTVHFHFRTTKTSAGISIFMSPLTLTWQDSRHAFAGLATVDVALFGRQHRPATFVDSDRADAAGALTAAGGGDEDLVGRQGVQQRAPLLPSRCSTGHR